MITKQKIPGVLKVIICLMLVMILLFLTQGCSETGNLGESAQSQIPAAPSAAQKAITLTPSEEAAAIGITAANYPRIDGSTSTLPLVQRIYKRMFHTSDNMEDRWPGLPEKASKTMKSYELLIAGDVDLILVPDPSKEVAEVAEKDGTELEYIPVGAEALVFITHEDNPVSNIDASQVQKIYADMSITDWSKLGGKNGRIVPICRNADSGSQAQLENLVLGDKKINPAVEENYMERDMNGMLQMVEEYRYFAHDSEENAYALGYTLYYYIQITQSVIGKMSIKTLAFNGVAPTAETILAKEYPLAINYYAVMRKDLPEDHPARKIAKWLQTRDGQWEVAVSGLGSLKTLYEPPQ
ncbi:MAG: substrate-binding domain-containing protein [Desulfosporosinus sp.]|nr:substrate-binding domain-containing protein [Desulfosporosinus sp.]MDA8223120.1 substrate-binding domain-containing protein [Desulfitobacterium hafniense]